MRACTRRRAPPDHTEEGGVSRIVRVAASSMATPASAVNQLTPNPANDLKLGLSILEAGVQRADLACLPEVFMRAGMPTARLCSLAEPISGPAVRAIADCARG
jgi:adenine deaminase